MDVPSVLAVDGKDDGLRRGGPLPGRDAVNQDPLARQAAPQPAPVIVIAHLADHTGANAEVSQDHRGVDRAAAGVQQEAVRNHKFSGPG